jgi:hypothetical protein
MIETIIMNKNFMIGFMYEGNFYCANVHRFSASRIEYHITILANKLKDGIPEKIVLDDREEGLCPVSKDPVPASLLEIIREEIQKHSSAN